MNGQPVQNLPSPEEKTDAGNLFPRNLPVSNAGDFFTYRFCAQQKCRMLNFLGALLDDFGWFFCLFTSTTFSQTTRCDVTFGQNSTGWSLMFLGNYPPLRKKSMASLDPSPSWIPSWGPPFTQLTSHQKLHWYSGWWLGHPSEKYESQLGWLFPIYGKIKNGNQTTNQYLIFPNLKTKDRTSPHVHTIFFWDI